MSECAECVLLKKASSGKELYPCSLCGERRCADHTIWVPMHELEGYGQETTSVREMMSGNPVSGWWAFCGKGAHVPRGLSIRHGKERSGGKIVRSIDEGKKEGLEFFKYWEVGMVQNSIENWWETKNIALSCSLATPMVLIAHLVKSAPSNETLTNGIYDKVIAGVASKKKFFVVPSREEYLQMSKGMGSVKDYASLICSFCKIVPCLNRQRDFHDKKAFRQAIKSPE